MIFLATVESATFAAATGEAFVVTGPGVTTRLDLVEVLVLGERRPSAPRDPFVLAFRGPSGLRLPQGIFAFEHVALGTMEIFITQTGDGPEGSQFEAVFT